MSHPQAQEIEDFREWTDAINEEPKDYTRWLERSKFFGNHSYEQLAILDAYKAYKLTTAKKSMWRRLVAQWNSPPLSDFGGTPVQEAARQLVKCLLAIGASAVAVQFERECHLTFQTGGLLASWKNQAKTGRWAYGPKVSRQQFPWCLERKETDLNAVRTAFSKKKLELKESTLSGGIPENLGVFTTNRAYERGALVFAENSATASPHDFFRDQTDTASRSLLADEAWSTLATKYCVPNEAFNFAGDIVAYVDAMDRTEPFSPDRDHWVFLMLYWRIDNNIMEHDNRVAVGKLSSFINHSCAPNVTGQFATDSKTPKELEIQLVATTEKIEAGRELFVSYLGRRQLEEDVSARRKRLQRWLGAGIDCQCEKCKAEDADKAHFE